MSASLPDDVDRLILSGKNIDILTNEHATKHGHRTKDICSIFPNWTLVIIILPTYPKDFLIFSSVVRLSEF